ncbi:MAG: hypothetical protein HFF17_10415 [Oscillospiraceae bacterium]|nr:hypothetical protein [Oscillospiraceae bacterium]
MKIQSTLVRMTPEQAMELAARENRGLLGKLADKVKGAPPEITVQGVQLFYYPLCVGGGVLSFPRAAHLPSRRIVSLAVVDCAFGYAQRMQGRPALKETAAEASQVVKRRLNDAAAREKLASFMRKQGYRKYRAIAEVEFKEFYLVYKPHYVCQCKRGTREFQRVIDAEIGQRDFMLDVKYRELTFEN